ncbi:type I 3-dehydroquinate dehydratase [Pyrofollis japonicus]|uniref:type I 3-dehydroquinate dehydratase n=1 Tax=Pyrofollis japonicus TaxID=3060460 RepID=UPI00295BA059|nr:type I 3-dehydroquinate dehydratase [Pyrofollis japonicus]
MACVPSPGLSSDEILELVTSKECRLVELRLDLLGYTRSEALGLVEAFASRGVRTIVTLRDSREGGKYSGSDDEKALLLLEALDRGAWLIDVEYRFPLLDKVLGDARGRVLVSFHDYRWTPPSEVLYSYAGDMIRRGAAIAKIVTMARSFSDNWRLIGLNTWRPGKVVAFAMGKKGRLSRILAPLAGAPFTYAALGEPVAPGQLGLDELLAAWRLLGAID